MDMTLRARQPGLPGKAWEGDGRARQQPSNQEEPEPIPHERVSVCSHTSPDKRSPHVTSSSSVDSHALAHGLTCLAGTCYLPPWLRFVCLVCLASGPYEPEQAVPLVGDARREKQRVEAATIR